MYALRKSLALIACIALLFGAMSPALSRVIMAAQGERVLWAEVCTASGMVRIPLEADAPSGESGGLVASVDCPCCRLQVDVGPAQRPPVVGLLSAPPVPNRTLDDQWTPTVRLASVVASPRGPPARA